MRKYYLALVCIILIASIASYIFISKEDRPIFIEEDEAEGYDGPAQRDSLNFIKMVDPALGYVPTDRIINAIEYTRNLKYSAFNQIMAPLAWVERGPIYDSVGPSNGNLRAGNAYTSGRMRGILIDTLNDPTGNKAFVSGVAGGLWRCSNFLSSSPGWIPVNDYFNNLAISSICQDPSNPSIMYFATGEATSNADAVYGGGIWKSTDAGISWTRLLSTTNFIRSFRILCDAAGNVYVAARPTTFPISQPYGLMRSKDKGLTWTNITPTGLTSNSICTDIEISSTGRLHASFGYNGALVNHRYTIDPANVTSATWSSGSGLRSSGTSAIRMELACLADTLYAITVNNGSHTDSCYKSVDGGATWTKQNSDILPSGLGSGQAWYNLTLAINPANSHEIIAGGLDAYRSTDDGQTMSRLTYWVTNAPYVHADHHFIQWSVTGGESRIIIGCDGGVFISRNGGATWSDRNKGLSIKQFYSAAIHPSAGSNYLLAGAQDNGVHQLKNPGLSYSTEVTGGDGCFVHINQLNPQIQFGSYVYNLYRRSVNGGATWSAVNLNSSGGLFVNPFDYDDSKNIMYACWGSSTIMRWINADFSISPNTLFLSGLGTPTAFKVSPHTPDRVFIGSNIGKVYRLDKADTVAEANLSGNLTNITGTSFPGGFINCVNVGTNDNYLVAVYSNYGVNNVWYSSNGGTSWTAIDGNLPDMPVRWAVFMPGKNDQLILATETGVWTTDSVNGNLTVWSPDPGFPTVRTDMLKIRATDNTIVAATHGRGLFTAVLPTGPAPQINFTTSSLNAIEETAGSSGCLNYKDYVINVDINNAPLGNAVVTYQVQGSGTATRGADFEFTANSSFNSPSFQHVFVSGSASTQSLVLRIYDDAEVESQESFTITFSISGATNAVAGAMKSYTVTLNDNDSLLNTSQPIAVNTQKTEYLSSNNDLYYYSAAGEVIARIRNLSTFNYGCTQVAIDRAGTGSSQFWNFNSQNYLMQKTYRVLPANNNPSGKYEITFYYTKEEKEGWEAATGQSWNNIQLVKVPGAISSVTPLNAQPDGPGTVQIVTPVRGTFGTGYTLTYTFENGFSGFGAGIPGRINTILALTGTLQNPNIVLNWTTTAEVNSTVFGIEKSYDGINFRKIGSVNAAGTNYFPASYSFTDKENIEINYYRVRMLHSDGYVLLSNTILVKNDNAPQRLFVLTNPFNNDIRMRFARVPTGKLLFSLYDMSGRLLKRYDASGSSGQVYFGFRATNVVSHGIYILDAFVDGKHYTVRVMKL